MYVITGATGNIGSKIADILLNKGERIRVVGRSAERLQRFVARGAEAAVGDLQDRAFLRKAFAGATAAFAMIPPDFQVKDFRAFQNEVGGSIAAASKDAGLKYIVNLSSQGAELTDRTGPIKGLHDQERRLDGLAGVNVLHLRPTYFMENLLMHIPLIKNMGIAGSAVRGDLEFAMIATKDIAVKGAELLTKHEFTGKQVLDLLGERDLSLKEAFTVIGAKIGIPDLQYKQFSYEDALKGMQMMGLGADVSNLFIEMSRALNEGLFAVNRPRTADNTTTTSIEEFADTFAKAFTATLVKAA